jgi:hypothetical protein
MSLKKLTRLHKDFFKLGNSLFVLLSISVFDGSIVAVVDGNFFPIV